MYETRLGHWYAFRSLLFSAATLKALLVDIDTGKSTFSFQTWKLSLVKWERERERGSKRKMEDILDNWNEINFSDNEINLFRVRIGRPSSQVARLHTFFRLTTKKELFLDTYIFSAVEKYSQRWNEIEIVPYARWINDENKLYF